MKDSTDLSLIDESVSSSLTHICINEILIRNHPYIISMCINNSDQIQIEIKVRAKETADQWKSTFKANDIESMTAKTGNFKSFNVFVQMLEDGINQKSSSVNLDLFTLDDFELLRKNQHHHETSSTKSSTKRYLLLIYNAEYDRIYYPLSLRYCGKPDTIILIEQIRQLAVENKLLKAQLDTNIYHSNMQEECCRLKIENDNYRQHVPLDNCKEKDYQVECLRHMIRACEDALIKERMNLQKTKAKKIDHYKKLNNQIELLRTSERQLKLKLKNLANEVISLKKNSSSCVSQQRSSSVGCRNSAHRHRSPSVIKRLPSSANCRVRFNPTAYIENKNHKLRLIQLQKKNETHQRLNTARHCSDSDLSDNSLKSHDNHRPKSNSTKHLSRSRTNKLSRHESKESIDSDIERVSSPIALLKASSNNPTKTFTVDHSFDNQSSIKPASEDFMNSNNLSDIDQKLKSLERFIKQSLRH